jgi:hypothetical protein
MRAVGFPIDLHLLVKQQIKVVQGNRFNPLS